MKILNHFTLLLLTLLVVSCSSRSGIKVNNLSHDSKKEGIVIGKVKILLNDINVTSNSVLAFNGTAWGTDMLQIENEDYFLIKLPEGKNNLEAVISRLSIEHRGLRYFFPEEKTTFNIDPAKINYIGDITITWTGPDQGPSVGIGGPFSAYGVSTTSTGHADISIQNNISDVEDFLNKKFPNNTDELNVCLLAEETEPIKKQPSKNEPNVRLLTEEIEPRIKQQYKSEETIEKMLNALKQVYEERRKEILDEMSKDLKQLYEEKRKEILDEMAKEKF